MDQRDIFYKDLSAFCVAAHPHFHHLRTSYKVHDKKQARNENEINFMMKDKQILNIESNIVTHLGVFRQRTQLTCLGWCGVFVGPTVLLAALKRNKSTKNTTAIAAVPKQR